MFLPIIHNMQSSDPAYAAAQHYNALIGNKPKINGTLAAKLAAINAWQVECNLALDAVKEIMGHGLPLKEFHCSYNDNGTPAGESEVFVCMAEDAAHAQEQCENAYPTAFVAECYQPEKE